MLNRLNRSFVNDKLTGESNYKHTSVFVFDSRLSDQFLIDVLLECLNTVINGLLEFPSTVLGGN